MLWDVLGLWRGVLEGLAKVDPGLELRGVGVDGWGVDYGLLDREGRLLANPHSYRDPRTRGLVEQALGVLPADELYRLTGVQPQPINTLYQLLAELGRARLDAAGTLLFIPDLLAYWLTGEPVVEATVASTSQLYDAGTGDWAWPVIERFGLPSHIFTPVVEPGAARGRLLAQVAEATGVDARAGVGVTAVASHDTASAVAAVQLRADGFGTSVRTGAGGVETAGRSGTQAEGAGLTNAQASRYKPARTKRVVDCCRRCRASVPGQGDHRGSGEWSRRRDRASLGPWSTRRRCFVGPSACRRIQELCARKGQRPPGRPHDVVRAFLESLGCASRLVLTDRSRVPTADRGVQARGAGARKVLAS